MSSDSDSEEFESADEGEVIASNEQVSPAVEKPADANPRGTASEDEGKSTDADVPVNSPDELKIEHNARVNNDNTEDCTSALVSAPPAEVQNPKSVPPVVKAEKESDSEGKTNLTTNDEIPPELLSKVSTRKMPSKERPHAKSTLGAKKLGAVKISSAEFKNSSQLVDTEKTDKPSQAQFTTSVKAAHNVEGALKNLELSSNTNNAAQETSRGWGWWAPAPKSLLNTVSSLTTQILSTVEAGLNIPDPEELARTEGQDRREEKQLDAYDTTRGAEKNIKDTKEEASSSIGLPFIGGMSSLTRLVESTGTRVLSTGLDTLELLGKKTMNVLQENDPGLKRARAALVGQLSSNTPSLAQVLREAKEREAAGPEGKTSEDTRQLPALLDQHQGLMHLEALEMLSEQCNRQARRADAPSESVFQGIRDACDLNEESDDLADVEPRCPDLQLLETSLATALKSVAKDVSHAKLMNEIRDGYERVQNGDSALLRTLAIDSLARLVSSALEIYHKCGELLVLDKSKNTPADWKTAADSLAKYSHLLRTEIQRLAEICVVKLVQSDAASTEHSTDIYMEASKCTGYLKTALRLMVPILQHCSMR